MQRGLRSLAGAPVRPYVQKAFNSGSNVYLELTFLDILKRPAIPVQFTWRIDNLTSDQLVQDYTLVTGMTSSQYTVNIPGALNIVNPSTGVTLSSQLNQVLITATYSDGSVATEVFCYEVIALQTVGGE